MWVTLKEKYVSEIPTMSFRVGESTLVDRSIGDNESLRLRIKKLNNKG